MYSKPTLYKVNDNQQQREWTVWMEENDDGLVLLKTKSGLVGGKLRVTEKSITELGRHDTLSDHAKHEVNKKWEDKCKKEGFSQSLETPNVVQKALPMLANKADIKGDKIKGITFPAFVQPKIDGFRCVTKITKDGKIEMLSRTNIPFKGFSDMKKELLKIVLPKTGFGSKTLYLDGELFIPDVGFSVLSGKIKRGQHHEDYNLSNLQYQLFDCFDVNVKDVSFDKRIELCMSITKKLNNSNIFTITTEEVNDVEKVLERFSVYLSNNDEGIMIRNKDSVYEHKRSRNLVKHKQFHDSEFEIIGFKQGEGEDAGTVVWQCKTKDNHEFWVRPKGTREERSEWFDNGDTYIGQWLTVTYQDLGDIGVPRFPVGKTIRPQFDFKK